MSPRTVLITGGAGAIGQAVAQVFARDGANLFLVDRVVAPTEAFLEAGAAAVEACVCDVADAIAIEAVAADCEKRFGTLDVIVNVAGAMIYKPIADLTAADWRGSLDVNLIATALFIGEGFRRMKPGSTIINISSIHARRTSPLVAPYAAAKAALGSLTRSAAIEGAALGIRVNAVLPGAIDTPMLHASPTIRSGAETLEPGDVGRPGDVAGLVRFLASDEARFITGEEIVADGGRLAKL